MKAYRIIVKQAETLLVTPAPGGQYVYFVKKPKGRIVSYPPQPATQPKSPGKASYRARHRKGRRGAKRVLNAA